MLTTAIFPSRYVQGANALTVLGEEVARLGSRALVLESPSVARDLGATIDAALKGHCAATVEVFGRECCDVEIERLKAIVADKAADVIVGIGGGKTLDTAKAVAHFCGLPVAVVPSLASTDAPCSALSVIYTAQGAFDRYLVLPKNPEVVLVDTAVIARAPARFLSAGMGDALATWFEAESCRIKQAGNMTGRCGNMTAYALARLCFDTLMDYGPLALRAADSGAVTPAFERIVEANTLLSGLGFESGGLGACHAIHNGLTVLPQTHSYWHGEKVTIGVLATMFLADHPPAMIDKVFGFCEAVNLPTTLADIGLAEVGEAELMRAAEAACAAGETIHNEPHEINPQVVLWALKTADAEGHRRKTAAREGKTAAIAESSRWHLMVA
ncbi:glycerol dehydrogenase, NAD [uncultured Alphaproteobacteria bacterium]|uniref:Glycerol dehydrogenase n=1 Tax=uncultured Alphaproteobacteria bacterium TaxID=91750 RepID=A0A212KLI2_9PROT|nr:glycerol dehydrogenase, NAD [uncultured Alphaproteobacteria bacterium]